VILFEFPSKRVRYSLGTRCLKTRPGTRAGTATQTCHAPWSHRGIAADAHPVQTPGSAGFHSWRKFTPRAPARLDDSHTHIADGILPRFSASGTKEPNGRDT